MTHAVRHIFIKHFLKPDIYQIYIQAINIIVKDFVVCLSLVLAMYYSSQGEDYAELATGADNYREIRGGGYVP